MRIKRLLVLTAISLMALGLVAAAGCASDSGSATIVQSADTIEPIPADQSDSESEPEQSGSIGIPAPGADDVDEMIVLDGALDSDDEGHDGPVGAPITEGEHSESVRPGDVKIQELPETDPTTGDDVPSILPVSEVPDDSGLVYDGIMNPDSCEGVLQPAKYPFELETSTATDSAKSDNPAINTMCLASYSSDAHESSLTVALITMNSADAAIAHYGIFEGSFADSGIDYSEQNSRDRDLIIATVDLDGMGAMVILRVGSNLVSLHNGPTSDNPQWPTDLMLDLADSILERL